MDLKQFGFLPTLQYQTINIRAFDGSLKWANRPNDAGALRMPTMKPFVCNAIPNAPIGSTQEVCLSSLQLTQQHLSVSHKPKLLIVINAMDLFLKDS